jgi:hypothetical protein
MVTSLKYAQYLNCHCCTTCSVLAVTFFVSTVSTDLFSVDVKCNYRSFLYVSWDFFLVKSVKYLCVRAVVVTERAFVWSPTNSLLDDAVQREGNTVVYPPYATRLSRIQIGLSSSVVYDGTSKMTDDISGWNSIL